MESRKKFLFRGEFKKLLANPKFVYVSDSLNASPQAVPVDEFAKKVHMTAWTETPVIESDSASAIKNHPPAPEISKKRLEGILQAIKANRNKMIITHMNDKVGYGVIAGEDLPQGTYLAIYTGLIRPVSEKDPLENHSSIYASAFRYQTDTTHGSVNAAEYGNIARFFQHAPEMDLPTASTGSSHDDMNISQISDYQISDTVALNRIATANLEYEELVYADHPLLIARTTRPIRKGELLVSNYGMTYWLNHAAIPQLFYQDGQPVDPDLYQAKKVILRLYRGERRNGFDNPHLDIKMPIDNFDLDSNNGKILIQADGNELLVVTKEDFLEQFHACPQSPYVVLQKPSAVIPLNSSENEAISSIRPSEVEKEKQSQAVSTLGLHGESKKTAVCAALDRIGASLFLPAWNYNATKDLAYITSPDEASMLKLKQYLELQGLKIQYGKNKNNNNPLIYLPNPDVKTLKSIPEIPSVQQTAVMGPP
ncbi:hypothetical protein AQUSIP_16260 [Aquicella siphonis]|uniref:SET domain-containing protein n=1 Tax=Aquicella siphonis TaxID=254247 RepID=A0A5E4PJ38_9COXI|nr:SET domain-containing protein-lysine N-methyltransferase [Aquicella siphonis]VVC76316.1 hypothetical protein AQUSIP_16260 [Aquicella siphonis]